MQLYCRTMNQTIAVADSYDLGHISIDHPELDYADLCEEFNYWTGLQNRYLERSWDAGRHHIIKAQDADYVLHTDASSSQMGSHLTPQTDHNTSLTLVDVRVFRYRFEQAGWRIHRKVINI